MAHRPVRGEALGSSECSFVEAGRLLRIFLAARKELITDAPDTFAQLLAVRQSLEHLGGATTALRQSDSRTPIRTAAQPPTASKTPSGRTPQTEAGKARYSVGQAAEASAGAEALGTPASLEQQRKEEKRRRKEERRRQKEEAKEIDNGAALPEAVAAARTGEAAEAELNEEERRREEKRLRKEERRRKREAAANGVKAGDWEESGLVGVGKTSGQNQGVSRGTSVEEEERKRAKEEKRKRKEEQKKARELGGVSDAAVPPPVSTASVGAASTKRPAEELDADQKGGHKRAKVDVPQAVSERPRGEENGGEPERSVGKKQRTEEAPESSAQPNGVSTGVPDDEAVKKEEKRRRKEEKRRAKEAAGVAGQPLEDAVEKGKKGTGKREREEGPASDAIQVRKKQRQLGDEKGTGKRSEAQVDGLEPRGGSSKKQKKEGGTGVASTELNNALAGRKEGKGEKSKEERKRQREVASSLDARQSKAGAVTEATAANESKESVFEEESREQKRARKEQKNGRKSEASGKAGQQRLSSGQMQKAKLIRGRANGKSKNAALCLLSTA